MYRTWREYKKEENNFEKEKLLSRDDLENVKLAVAIDMFALWSFNILSIFYINNNNRVASENDKVLNTL